MDASKPKEENFFREILKASLIALVIVVPIRFYVAQPFIVQGASMDPTFGTGHYLVVDQLTYRFEAPERGDVVVFRYPKDTSKFFIKRIIGLPGEKIEESGGVLHVINEEYPDGFTFQEPYVAPSNATSEDFSMQLDDDEYFVMGDNRRASSDSRMWGPLREKLIIGRAFFRVLPINQSTLLPGAYTATF